ncbi:phospholipase D-like domain-containing protein [Nubsella zeaxanthinifaciens]|uniref:phospholipase D-like domain-containing protein n=1 Tax=Nubsella zeaxanthinifaciens TaxID=392412 RepID=UPI0013004A43|nr:phospholipase D-like domain-containing protein [Nubsella zeaxanthinifaciens]
MRRFLYSLLLVFTSLTAFSQANLQSLPQVLFTAPGAVAKGSSSPIILNKIIELVDNTPANDTISMSIYMFNYDPLITAIKNADTRGVILRLIIDNSRTDSQDVNASTFTKLSTLSSNAEVVSFNSDASTSSINHTKFVLFSRVNTTSGLQSKILVQSSHNFTSSDSKKLQDAIIFNHVGLYNSFWKYFNEIKTRTPSGMAGYTYTEYTDAAAGIKACFLPRRGTSQPDNIIDILNSISNVSTAKIRVGMSDWVVSRLNVAQKLTQLSAAGARVEVVVKNKIDPEIQTELAKLNNTGGYLKMYNLVNDDDPTVNIHAKFMVIEGTINGVANTQMVVTGSHNFTTNALRYNNEILMVLTNSPLFNAYATYFDNIKYIDPPVSVARWNFRGLVGNEASVAAAATASGITADPVTRGSGYNTSNTLGNGFSSAVTSFSTSSLTKAKTNNEFFQFALNVNLTGDNVLSLYAIDARIRRSGNGNNNFIWAYSLDGNNYTDVPSSATTFTDSDDAGIFRPTVDLRSIAALQALAGGTKVYFRLYGWGATTSGGSFAFGRSATSTEATLDVSGVSYNVLPVQLNTFTAKAQNNKVKVEWQTLSEKHNASFTLLRSAEAAKNYNQVYLTSGQDTKSTLTTYQFDDLNPLNGANYYKLIQTDLDGNQQVYGPITAKVGLVAKNTITTFALANTVEVKVNFDQQASGQLALYNINGSRLTTANVQLHTGVNSFSIPANITAGVYLIKLTTQADIIVNKFVKN